MELAELDIKTLEAIKTHYESSRKREQDLDEEITSIMKEAETIPEILEASRQVSILKDKDKFIQEQIKMFSNVIKKIKEERGIVETKVEEE